MQSCCMIPFLPSVSCRTDSLIFDHSGIEKFKADMVTTRCPGPVAGSQTQIIHHHAADPKSTQMRAGKFKMFTVKE